MKIEIRLFATLRNDRFKKENREVPVEMTPMGILNDLDIPKEDVAILLINGRDGAFDQPLKEEDVLSIFPPVGGG